MSQYLNPLIQAKLEAFALRRRRLIITRGVCIGAAVLLASMMVVAIVDREFIIEDRVRWMFSGAAYVLVLWVVWFTALRSLLHLPDSRQLARLVEHVEPKLREDLLSAVELGRGDAGNDSAQFRALLQADVATRMDWVEVGSLLPMKLVRRPLVIAVAVFAICAVAIAIPHFEFGTSLMRALLPMANLDRVSKVKVRIVEPSPAEGNIPQGDAVPLEIEITGEVPDRAVLEIFTKDGRRDVVQMNAEEKGEFTSSIQVAREDLDYRIRSGGAITRKYALRAVERPHVTKFHKKYMYPAYTKLPPREAEEVSGDLNGIEGTEAELGIQTDQRVKGGELRLEQGKTSKVIPLIRGADGRLSAKVPLDVSGIYRVHLVSASTGFENKFSPEFEIRAEPDLVPKVEMDAPARDLILPANEVVDIAGTASDDLSVSSMELDYRVNGGSWTMLPLKIVPGPKVSVAYRWDLFQKGLKAGDSIGMKLAAYDLRGQRSETRTVQLTLTSAGFDQKRLSAIEGQRKLYVAYTELRTSAEALEKVANGARDKFNQTDNADPQRVQAGATLSQAMDEFDQKRAATVAQLMAVVRAAPSGHTSGQYVLLGRITGSAAAVAQNARQLLSLAEEDPAKPFARNLMRDASDRLSRVAQRVRLGQDGVKAFLGSEEIDIANEYLRMVTLEQERIGVLVDHSSEAEEQWTPIRARLHAVTAEAAVLEELLSASVEHVDGNAKDRLRQAASQINEQRTGVERRLGENAPPKELADRARNLGKVLRETRRSLLDLRAGYVDPPVIAAQHIQQEIGVTWANFDKLREEVQWALGDGELGEEARPAVAAIRWNARSAAMKADGDYEEARQDADVAYIQDVRSISLTLNALLSQGIGKQTQSPEWEKTKQSIAALDQNFRILESGHDLFAIASGLDSLAVSEKWEMASARVRTTSPRDWKWLEYRLLPEADALGRTQLVSESARKLMEEASKLLSESLREPMRHLGDEMSGRFNADREPVSMNAEAMSLADLVRQALELLRTPMEDARRQITQLAPKLSDLAQELARQADALKKASEREAKEEDPKPAQEAQAEARRELSAQQQLNEKINALRDALRSEAGKQNLDEAEGREKSRDADDALGMLNEPPEKAESALAEAAQLKADAERSEAFKAASNEQKKLTDSLDKIAKHYDAMEKGEKAAESRQALRESEVDNGQKEALDRRYEHLEQLAKLKGLSVSDMLAKLEKALRQNAAMRDELRRISQQTLEHANERLAAASQKQNEVAGNIQKMATQEAGQQPPQQNPDQPPAAPQPQSPELARAAEDQWLLASAASTAGQEISRVGRHEERLNSPVVGNQLKEAGKRMQELADKELEHAEQVLATSQQAAQAQKAVDAANEQLQQELKQLAAASTVSPTKSAETQLQAGTQPNGEQGAGKEAGAKQQAGNQPSGEQGAGKEAGAKQQAGNQPNGEQGAGKEAGAKQQAGNQPSGEQGAGKEAGAKQQAGHQPNGEQGAGKEAGAKQQAGNQPSGEQGAGKEVGAKQQAGNQPSGEQGAGKESGAKQQAGMQPGGEQGAGKEAGANLQPGNQPSGEQGAGKEAGTKQQAASSAPDQHGASQQSGVGESPTFREAAFTSELLSPEGSSAVSSSTLSTEEQKWMARALDLLDSAMHASNDSHAAGEQKQSGQNGENAQSGKGQKGQAGKSQQAGKPGQGDQPQGGDPAKGSGDSAEAKQAMDAASDASKASMRQSRASGEGDGEGKSESPEGKQQSVSKGGLNASSAKPYKAPPEGQMTGEGDWGKLPKQVAEQMSQGQRETVPGEYRNQVETYYRVIAEKAKKP